MKKQIVMKREHTELEGSTHNEDSRVNCFVFLLEIVCGVGTHGLLPFCEPS